MEVERKVGCWRKFANWFKLDRGEWLKEMRGSLSLTASIIATMSFQLGTNPPGGVIQAGLNDQGFKNCINFADIDCPGLSVMAVLYPHGYQRFLISNAISFFASVSVCLLLVSGIPLNHRLPTWLLSIGMCIAITGLAYSYALGVTVVTPNPSFDIAAGVFGAGLLVWIGLLGIVFLFLIIRLFVWVVNKCIRVVNKCGACF